jgi:phosphatidylglycerol---prolipoprotein diacylglyceryl transferase
VPPLPPIPAVIQLTFSPVGTLGGVSLRLETIALAVVVLVCLVLAVLIGRRTPVNDARATGHRDPVTGEPNHLRADDLLYLAVAALPGAAIGGRLGYALLHLDYYRANASALLDVSAGSLQLSLAVVGGTITAAVVIALLGAPVRRWMHALTLPLLLALAGGKLAMALGGDGQGAPFDGAWATAYAGPGPWGSLGPQIASHPSQVYEALVACAVLLLVMALMAAGSFRDRRGGTFLLAIALWAIGRAAVAATWRDPVDVGPLRADQMISLVIAAVAIGLLLLDASSVSPSQETTPVSGGVRDTPAWPDRRP